MSAINFLNIDLDIEAKEDASLIVKEFDGRVSVMREGFENGLYHASFETPYSDEDTIIEEYASLINGLSSEAKRLWQKCTKRSFDFGYELGEGSIASQVKISEKSISTLSRLGGSVVITIYPPEPKNT